MRKAAALVTAGASLLALCSPAGAVDRGREPRLLPMSREQVQEAGAAGTGCSFLVGDGRSVLFAATDDRAVVRLATGIVPLRPAPRASDLFPFTFDRWRGGGHLVALRASARAVRRGSESTRRAAVLGASRGGGRVVRRRGLLECGS